MSGVPRAHRAYVSRTRFLGAKRHQARCEDCPFMGELRRERDSAEEDAAMHAGAPAGMPAPREPGGRRAYDGPA